MENTQPEGKPPGVTSPGYVGTLTHLYRGELGRMMVWRQRFDATSNWAIIATGSLIAFAVGNRSMMAEAMLINLGVLGFFAFIEARRYRFYDAFRARVRILEVHFIAPAFLGDDVRLLEGRWREQLVQDLITPSFKCSFSFALGRRFRHIYGALHVFVLFSWSALISFEASTLREWIDTFGMGAVPGEVIIALVLLYVAALVVVIVRSGALLARSGEVRRYRRDVNWRALIEDSE